MRVDHDQAAPPGASVRSGDRTGDDATYTDFLSLDALFAAVGDAPDHPDGPFFVVAHQTYELWFELLLGELVAARDAMYADAVADALYRLRRVVSVERLLVAQLETLTTISPGGFRSLRPHLGTASGFQSVRFREIEVLSGLRDPQAGQVLARERPRLQRRWHEPSLWDAFCALLRRHQVTDLVDLLRSGRPDHHLADVAEALLDHDEAWAVWRARHALMVERVIGRRPGTGGSSGVDYLNARRDERFFPALWQARTRLAE